MHSAPADRPALEAKITAPRATAFMQWLSSLWRDKGVQVTAVNAEQLQMVLPEAGTVLLHIRSSRELACCILCNSAEMGERLQLSVTECLGEFADEMAWPDGSWDIVWEGQAPRSPAQLHVLRVLGNLLGGVLFDTIGGKAFYGVTACVFLVSVAIFAASFLFHRNKKETAAA